MKELPILYSGTMVRALLGGRKGQTRRIVNPLPQMRDPPLGGRSGRTAAFAAVAAAK